MWLLDRYVSLYALYTCLASIFHRSCWLTLDRSVSPKLSTNLKEYKVKVPTEILYAENVVFSTKNLVKIILL